MDTSDTVQLPAQDEGGSMETSRVHFQVDQVVQHDAEIQIKPDEGKLSVHLGFLQVNHCYKIQFSIVDSLHEDITFNPLQNLHVRIIEYQPTEDGRGHQLTIELVAYKEKLMKEELTITDSQDESKTVTLVLFARVLGKGKGTPMLKRGITCTGMSSDYDSDATDWQGFD